MNRSRVRSVALALAAQSPPDAGAFVRRDRGVAISPDKLEGEPRFREI